VLGADCAQGFDERELYAVVTEELKSAIAGDGQEVDVAELVVAAEAAGHGGILLRIESVPHP
jgi:hypothetical protein